MELPNCNDGTVKRKEVKVTLQKDINAYLYVALPLCVILAEEKLFPWYYENYIEIVYTTMKFFQLEYLGTDLLSFANFANVLDIMPFSNKLLDNSNSIVKILTNNIDNGYCAYIFFDEFFLPDKEAYKKYHFYHESLIYGYDDNIKKLMAIAFDKNGVFNKITYDYDLVEEAFSNAKLMPKYFNPLYYPLVFFKVKNFHSEYKFCLKRFLTTLNRYINSTKRYDVAFFTSCLRISGSIVEDNLFYGFDIYEPLIFDLKQTINNNPFEIFRNLHFLFEHKKGIYKRLKYISKQFNIKGDLGQQIDNFEKTVRDFGRIRMLMLKFMYLQNSDEDARATNQLIKLKEKIIQLLVKSAQEEKANLVEVYRGLRKIVILEIPKIIQPNIALSAILTTSLSHEKCALLNNNSISKWNYGYDADNIQDNQTSWIMLTWQQPKLINRICLIDTSGASMWSRLGKISFSDGSDILLTDCVDNFEIVRDYSFEPKMVTWLRFDEYDVAATDISYIEIQVFEASLAWGKPIVASSYWEMVPGSLEEEHTPEKAIDGRSDTFWNAKDKSGAGEYLEIDLVKPTAFNCVALQQREPPRNRITGYKIQYSLEGESWNDIYVYLGGKFGDDMRYHYFQTVTAQKVRLLITGTQIDEYGYSEGGIRTFELYYFQVLPDES